ncbi:MtnX-like HAD-IB family phosphatase [Rhizorhabdus argentea]|uniref:MtnX-like HAD-IB family phosphatase n=1 Tax=Rhizorhabdus argentea TaxID=1387174 RepID=UPI0030EB538A
MRIYCDFDGTISSTDTADLVFGHFADPKWEAIEASWNAGEIEASTCMKQQVELIAAPLADIETLLGTVSLRSGFREFLGWSKANDIPVSVVSDGVDHFIRHILIRHGIDDVPVIANRLVSTGPGRWSLDQPWRKTGCKGGCGVCKCAIVETGEDERPTVFIGDGRSDFCVAAQPDILFATAGLDRFCGERSIPFLPFNTFADVQAALAGLTGLSVARAA